ncbi:GNAT family N-acetyltransferase [Erythrobacter sp. Alg231-14]|uniref:GNAT family N-acetyltransferase n=1 Tax=Erythrobacter sp. Alg231-14 TaxID=1922225 RepID=UPI000D561886
MNDSAIDIVRAQSDDTDQLALIGAATFLESFAGIIDGPALVNHCAHEHAKSAYDALLSQGAMGWLAQLNGAPIGYAVICQPDLDAAMPGDIELKRIYLLSKFHGTGVAKRLFEAAWDDARKYERLLLGVKDDNHRAIAFYKKQGFDQIAVRKFNVGGRVYDDLVLARPTQTDPR